MDATAVRIQELMVDACELLDVMITRGGLDARSRADLSAIRGDLLFAADVTIDPEAADAALGMSLAIEAVVTRIQKAAAAA